MFYLLFNNIFLFICTFHCFHNVILSRPTEQERVKLWYDRGNQWPPIWQNENEGYINNMNAREKEILLLTGADERWENYMQYCQGRMVPKFTELGFEVIQTPIHIHNKLANKVKQAIDNYDTIPYEYEVEAIFSQHRPKFVNMDGLDWEVIKEMKTIHENWIGGIKLEATSAYGVRLYQNQSSLVMHYDKIHSHVISSIVHIIHDYDDENEPWPIQIEDHYGNLHSVNLEVGQTLFYESAKCLHGRMKEFKGKYYGSIFLHYQPVDKNIWNFDVDQVIANVPPHWNEGILEDHGSRWAGQAITVDSMTAIGSPNRTILGEYIHNNKSPHSEPTKLNSNINEIKNDINDEL